MRKLAVFLSFVLFSCSSVEEKQLQQFNMDEGIELDNMDMRIRPQDDFYGFVNGAWMKRTEIPADRSRWGSFDELRKETNLNLLKLIGQAIKEKKYTSNTDQGKAIAYYQSYTDTVSRKKNGIKPVLAFLADVENITGKNELTNLIIRHYVPVGSYFFGFHVGADMKNSRMNTLYAYPDGGGLPERAYYFDNSEEGKKIRKKYVDFVTEMFVLYGFSENESKIKAQNILRLETALMKNRMTKEERRRPENRYNPLPVETFDGKIPLIDIKRILDSIGLHTDQLIVTDLNYFDKLNQLLDTTGLIVLKDFMLWKIIRSSSGTLTPQISRRSWEFYGKFLEGVPKRRSLEERALLSTNRVLGEALGKVYVDEFFPPQAKSKAMEMVRYLQKAYIKRIENLTWMSDSTKKKAIEKVKTLTVKIGYPDKWKDYSNMQIESPEQGGNLFANTLQVRKWNFSRQVKKLNKPVDKTEWGMPPQTVNAYYNPLYNEIVFPAAILQPPFYNYKADEAVNYGGMGAVIGHEISHGFDDQGAKFDSEGNFNNWWRKEDFEAFNKLVKAISEQYSKIEVLPGVFINGEFTAGENIADFGGVNAAYDALQMYFADHGKPGKIQGFTPEQRFFISWTTVWRSKIRPEALKKQIKTDPHAPARVRAVQPFRNMEAFYRAFSVKEGDKMYLPPQERVVIW